MRQKISNKKGNITIETIIIFTTIMLIIYSLIFCFILMLQSVVLTGVAASTAQNEMMEVMAITNTTAEHLKKSVLDTKKIQVEIQWDKDFFKNEVEVKLQQDVIIPSKILTVFFEGESIFRLRSMGKARSFEEKEYINNVDTAIEYFQKTKEAIK